MFSLFFLFNQQKNNKAFWNKYNYTYSTVNPHSFFFSSLCYDGDFLFDIMRSKNTPQNKDCLPPCILLFLNLKFHKVTLQLLVLKVAILKEKAQENCVKQILPALAIRIQKIYFLVTK